MFKKNIANMITGIRFILFWIIISQIYINSRINETAHMIWFIAAGIIYALDFLDGYVARKTRTCSEFGADFDPLGDKLVAVSMLMLMVYVRFFPAWVLGFIVFREIVVTSIRHTSKKYNVSFETSSMGKFRTNVIGFGGGLLYAAQYWDQTAVWITTGSFAVILLFNILIAPNRMIMSHYKNWFEKIVVLVTIMIASIYPLITIPISMFVITLYTLVDYSIAFYIGARGSGIAKQLWFVRIYLFVFKKRHEDTADLAAQKVLALEQAQERLLTKIARKHAVLAEKERAIRVKYENKIARTVDRSKRRRWTSIVIFLLLNTVIALLMAGALAFGLYFTWLGKYTLISAILLISFVFIGQLIAKIALKQQQTNNISSSEASSDPET